MELEELSILKYITDETKPILSSYLSENVGIYNVLAKYDEISYLGSSERFFFLFKEHEKFINKNDQILHEYLEHRKSVIGLLYMATLNGYYEENASIFNIAVDDGVRECNIAHFPEEINFEYQLTNNESVICLIDIFFNVEINRIIYYVVSKYMKSLLLPRLNLLNYEVAFNDDDFVNLYPFLFKGLADLITNVKSISDEFEFSNKIINNYKIINNKFNLLPAEIKSRTKCDYIKCYNFYEFRRLGDDYLDFDEGILLYLENFFFPRKLRDYEPECYITFFIVSLDFQLPKLDFMNDYDKKYYLKDFISVFDDHHGIVKEMSKEEKEEGENQLRNNVKAIFDNSKYRSLLKLNINHSKVIELFDGFVERVLSNNKQLKKDFKDLFTFIADESINTFPTTNQLTVKDIKYVMRFFSKYKGEEFEYNVPDLQYLLTHFANKPEQYKNSSIDKAHREERFNLDLKIQKALNSLVR
ncbi:hypothetical protein [Chryseobacterium sp.]|uniref:hypothetical protein n=1 Tax=Chryseobacterium sp. TaxID=1871047 RepID=UPI00289AC5E8|nr:hypothetical protein [Chryseobacterium sp.]